LAGSWKKLNSANPFEFDGAPNLSPKQIREWFIDDYSYARFINSTRNVLLLGQRGSGKSMTLMYFTLPVQLSDADSNSCDPDVKYIGIYVPCNTPLTHKREYQLFENKIQQAILSEHYLVLGMALKIAEAASLVAGRFSDADMEILRDEFSDLFDIDVESSPKDCLGAVRRAIYSELRKTQESINDSMEPTFRARTFYTLVLPMLAALKETSLLRETHFLLMIDDAQDLNSYQRQSLNSWLSYRDHSLFSFKVAIAKVADYDYHTASGGTILEGHDFVSIDLEQPFQNYESRFGKLARDIIDRRLKIAGIPVSPEEFFPENETYRHDIEQCEQEAAEMARQKNPLASTKNIQDYVYKYARAIYFRKRSSKANKPLYTGLDTLVHLSTGVIRNLLDPCYWMYDDLVSRTSGEGKIEVIPASVQADVISKRSERLWERIRAGIDNEIEGCSSQQAKQIANLFENLAKLFRERLLNHKSEPRIITFSISGRTEELNRELDPLLNVARRAQLLYVRSGSAKDEGLREDYFTPNRMLWPAIGLDPNGQHGRISLPASQILAAARDGKPFPYVENLSHPELAPQQGWEAFQQGLFDDASS
jgi:hypothetical protein